VRDKVRERAREERKTGRSRKQKKTLTRKLKKIRRAVMERRALRFRRAKAAEEEGGLLKSIGKGVEEGTGGGFRGALGKAGAAFRVAGLIVTIVMVAADLLIKGGQFARKFSGGQSQRLIDATDADTMYGGMDEEIAANLATVSFVEGNQDLLRIIGKQGRVNNQIADLMNEKRKLFLMQIQGMDKINRDPLLDAPETIVEMLISKANHADLKGLADKAGAAVRSKTLKGPIKSRR